MRAEYVENPNFLEVFHFTDTVEEAKSIKKNGYEPGKRGRGHAEAMVFSSLVQPIPKDFITNYGKVMIKFLIPIKELKNFIIWEPSIIKKVWGKMETPANQMDNILFGTINEDKIIKSKAYKKLSKKFPKEYDKIWYFLDPHWNNNDLNHITSYIPPMTNNSNPDSSSDWRFGEYNLLDLFIELGFKGFCGKGRFLNELIYLGSYDLSIKIYNA